jgi:DNA-binding response OmpR family regulator
MQTPSRMLVVDDEPLIGMMMEDFLAVIGVGDVVIVEDVERALFALEGAPFDAAILDVNLARGVRSDAVAHRLTEMGVPFMVCSGDSRIPDGWGSPPMLTKPYTLSDIERTIARM